MFGSQHVFIFRSEFLSVQGKRFLKSSACFLAGVSIFNVAYCEPVGAIYEEEKEEALKKLDFLKRAYKFATDVALSEGGKLRFIKVLRYDDYIGKEEIDQMGSALKDFKELIEVSYKVLNDFKEPSNIKRVLAKAILDSFKDMFSVKSEELEKYNENFDVNKYITGVYPTNNYFDFEKVKTFNFRNFTSETALKSQNIEFICKFRCEIFSKLIRNLGTFDDAVVYKFVNDNGGAESVYKMLCAHSQYENLIKALEWINNACKVGQVCKLAKCLKEIMFAADYKYVLKLCAHFSTLEWCYMNFSKRFFRNLCHIIPIIGSLLSNSALQEFYTQCICILTKRLFNDSLMCEYFFNRELLYPREHYLYEKGIWKELPYGCPYKIAVQLLYKFVLRNKVRRSELAAEEKNEHDIKFVLPTAVWNGIFEYLTTEEKLNALPKYLWKGSKKACPLGRESSMEGRLVELALYCWKITKTTEMLSKFDNIVALIEKEDVTENDKLKILDSDSLIAIVERLIPEDKAYLLNYLFPDRFEKFEKWGRIAAICFPGFDVENFNEKNKAAWIGAVKCLTEENKEKLLSCLWPDRSKEKPTDVWYSIALLCFPDIDPPLKVQP